MKRALIIIGHGSRSAEATAQFHQIVEMIRERRTGDIVLPAFMENAIPRLPDAIAEVVALGAVDIAIVPCFLYQGIHIKEDIPEMLAELKLAHPQVTVRFGRPIGADPRLADIVCDRAEEVLCHA
jgi:sirohydrochlorin cobaltochelatase